VQYRPHFLRWQVDIGLPIVAEQKAVAVTVAMNHPFDVSLCGATDGGVVG
jgi:hypothetical protein